MSTVLAITARELRERSRLFIVAAVAALVPFAASLVPAASGNRGTIIATVAGFLSVAFAFGLALALGGSTICGDLAEKRLSFYFSKPISPTALWAGKAIAAMFVCFASLAIIALPSFIAARRGWESAWRIGGDRLALFAVASCVTLFLLSHALSTMVRSRSLLVALDFVLTVAALAMVGVLARPLIAGGGAMLAGWLVVTLVAAVLLILAVAPVWQLAKGRTDLRRSHAALSKFLWSAVAVLLLLATAFIVWVVSVTPSGLVETGGIAQAPSGGGMVVVGRGRNRGDYVSSFLINPDGSYERLASPPWNAVRWSRDGRVSAWIQPAGYFPRIREFELYAYDVATKRGVATGIRVGMLSPFALSDDGARVAVVSNKTVSVHDLRDGRVLMSAAGVTERYAALFFVTPDLVRVIDHAGNTTLLYELDVARRSFAKTGQREVPKGAGVTSMSHDGSRLYVRSLGEIADGRTGMTISKIAPSSAYGAAMLGDGSVVDPLKTSEGVRLRWFTRDGRLRGETPLPHIQGAFVCAETSDGKVVVAGRSNAAIAGQSWTTFVIDRARGVVERAVPSVCAPIPQWSRDPRLPQREAGRPFAALDQNRKLVLVDLRTGAIKRL